MCGSIPRPVVNIVTKFVVPPRKDSLCNFPVPPDLNVVIRSYEFLSSPKPGRGPNNLQWHEYEVIKTILVHNIKQSVCWVKESLSFCWLLRYFFGLANMALKSFPQAVLSQANVYPIAMSPVCNSIY